VNNLLTGLKVAGYIGCQTVRPFAATEGDGNCDTYDQLKFLDNFVKVCSAEAVSYDPKTSCCGGSVSVPGATSLSCSPPTGSARTRARGTQPN
jgi:heterodisulfide reductase subunit B